MNQFQAIEAIRGYLAVIGKEQLPDGGFLHQSWFAGGGDAGGDIVEYKTTFFPANILACLNSVADILPQFVPEISSLRERATQFLLAQKSEHWSFNYWARDSREARAMPYPDDLDDTFVALAALHGYRASLIDAAVLACVARILTAVEVVPGGPYRTWLVRSGVDVDVAVNANIAYFLSLLEILLPNLSLFINEHIRAENLHSPYYPGPIQAIYFISRWYRGDAKAALVDMLLREDKQDLLATAMAVSAAINLGFSEKISERDVLILGGGVGLHLPNAFCVDPSRDGRMCYAGSAPLTAAFCAEALAKWISAGDIYHEKPRVTLPLLPEISFANALLSRIKILASAKCSGMPEHLKQFALDAIESIVDEKIVMVPYAMYSVLGEPRDIPGRFFDELALANLYGWIAYTIYDDFLDGDIESGSPEASILSVANFFLRELTLEYAKLGAEIPFLQNEYTKVMNIIDEANIEERNMSYVSRDDLEKLADRSFGHALPALAVLFVAGYSPDSHEAAVLVSFFRNYLIARQLHDDAHDWKEDFLQGRITSVVAQLFQIQLFASRSISDLQKLFWYEVVPGVVADIIFFLDRARCEIAIFKNPAPFFKLLDQLKNSVEATLHERDVAIQFVEAYRGVRSISTRAQDLQTP